MPTIRNLRATAVLAPLAEPIHTAVGSIETAPLLLIDIHTEEGITGHGMIFTYNSLVLQPLHQLVTNLDELLRHQPAAPFEIERLLQAQFQLLGTSGLVSMALAGVDMALWDILAKTAKLSLVEFLGGRRMPIGCYPSLSMQGPQETVKQAEAAVKRGFRILKLRFGYPNLADDLHVLRAVRAAVGQDVKLLVDYNQSLTLQEAMRRCRALDQEEVSWIEEPIAASDISGHAEIAAATDTPIQLGENWNNLDEMARSIASRASDFVMPDVVKIGGVSGWLRAASLAQAERLPCSSHLYPEISAHLLSVTPTALWLEYSPVATSILSRPMDIVNGYAQASKEPGNGLIWNAAAVRQFAA